MKLLLGLIGLSLLTAAILRRKHQQRTPQAEWQHWEDEEPLSILRSTANLPPEAYELGDAKCVYSAHSQTRRCRLPGKELFYTCRGCEDMDRMPQSLSSKQDKAQ